MEGLKATDIKGLVEKCFYPPSIEFNVSDEAPVVSKISIYGSDKKNYFRVTVTKPEHKTKKFNTHILSQGISEEGDMHR